MERAIDDAVAELSALLLAASFALIGASLLGVGGTIGLAAVFAITTVALFLVREHLGDLAASYPLLARTLSDLWIGTTAATVTVLVALGATPGELQTLGGLIGLAGMLNYFVRPLYRLLYRAGRWVAEATGG